MKNERTEQSVEKLVDAIGGIKEEYLTEAHAKEETIKWKRVSRRAGILIAAACVILIAAAIILIPGTGNKQEAVMEAGHSGADGAFSEMQNEALEAATEEIYVNEAPAAAEQAEDAEEFDMAGNSSNDAVIGNREGGIAARFDRVLISGVTEKETSAYEYPDGYEPENGLIIESADQFSDYLKRAGFELRGPFAYQGEMYTDIREVFKEDFFKEHNLAIAFVELNSGSYEASYLSTTEKGSTAEIHYNVYRQDTDPKTEGAVITTDMADWMLFAAVSKDVKDVLAVEEAYPYTD